MWVMVGSIYVKPKDQATGAVPVLTVKIMIMVKLWIIGLVIGLMIFYLFLEDIRRYFNK